MRDVGRYVQQLRLLVTLPEASPEVRDYAEAVLEHYDRNRDLGWPEAEAYAIACQKARPHLPPSVDPTERAR